MYASLKGPLPRDLNSFQTWIWDNKPLTAEETTFVEHTDDFVALSEGQEYSRLDGVVEDTLNRCLPKAVMRVRYFPDPILVRDVSTHAG